MSWSDFVLCFQQEEEDPDKGQPCMRCGDQCPGFRVHGWRYELLGSCTLLVTLAGNVCLSLYLHLVELHLLLLLFGSGVTSDNNQNQGLKSAF